MCGVVPDLEICGVAGARPGVVDRQLVPVPAERELLAAARCCPLPACPRRRARRRPPESAAEAELPHGPPFPLRLAHHNGVGGELQPQEREAASLHRAVQSHAEGANSASSRSIRASPA